MEKIRKRVEFIYGTEQAEEAMKKLESVLQKYPVAEKQRKEFSQEDTMLITYGDSIVKEGTAALKILRDFLEGYVKDAINSVHILPMYPYTSDDGFSVVDYRKIHTDLGIWQDIEKLSESYGLMFDAVINHISKSSEWFQKYLAGEEPYKDYFITCNPKEDYGKVIRPRALPLLTEVVTSEGKKYVWTTFSDDQIDLNFRCPQLLAEIVDVLLLYAQKGAKYIRLDAIGFMWKEKGTGCMHLPQTHEIIKLIKDIFAVYAPDTKIVTETNVPHKDNISYFGENGDEADMVYQFPLPPLTLYSFLTGNAQILSKWIAGLNVPNEKVTYFNFLSSHDGIGMRPTEGILSMEQQQVLIQSTLRNGGEVSYKDNGDGTKSPYELNINYQDALAAADESDEVRIAKFLAAETILLSVQGIPGIYIHSLLGSRNDYYGKTTSNIPRRINREKLDYDFLVDQLSADTNRRKIFNELIRRIEIRKKESAFSPHADQKVLSICSQVLLLKRKNKETEEEIYTIINVSGEEVCIEHSEIEGVDLLSGNKVSKKICLGSWECMWVKSGCIE